MGIRKEERPKGRPLLGGAGPDYPLAMAMGWWGPVKTTVLATSSTSWPTLVSGVICVICDVAAGVIP